LPTGDEAGFTLLEVLVALAILSVSLATLLGIFSMNLDRARQSEAEMGARTLAQSLIAQTDVVIDPKLGSRSGRADGGFSWRVDLKPFAPALASVSASVMWQGSGGNRSLTLYSLRPIPAAPVR
jgi:general secretion pathway protein I